MPSEAAAVRVTESFQRTLERIYRRTGALTVARWDALGSWNDADVARFTAQVDQVFAAARIATVNASAGYYSLMTDAPPVQVNPASLVVQVDLRAPFTAYWHGLAEGRPWLEAIDAGRSRAESTAIDYVTSTSRRTASSVAADGIVGWRRVLTGNSCRWCATVATQRYRTVESADFGHDFCDCTVAPIYGDSDPGQVINAAHVERLAGAAA